MGEGEFIRDLILIMLTVNMSNDVKISAKSNVKKLMLRG